MIYNRNQNTRFRSITDCFYCIVVEEIKISLTYQYSYKDDFYRRYVCVGSLESGITDIRQYSWFFQRSNTCSFIIFCRQSFHKACPDCISVFVCIW